jgi:uridine kinase
MDTHEDKQPDNLGQTARYSPPWADMSIIGIAGSSGSGKSSVALEIINSLNLPWVVILVMVGTKYFDLHM